MAKRPVSVLTEDEAADFLKIRVATFRAWCRSGKIEASKRGRHWFTRWEWIEDFILGDRNAPIESLEDIFNER